MRYITHLAFTVVCLLVYLNYYSVQNMLLFFSIALFTTLFVDIDEPESALGRIFWPFSKFTNFVFGHRGLLHSILVPVFFYCIFAFFLLHEVAYAITLGYVSHLIMDMITPAGIFPLYPLKWRIHGPVKTGSFFEYFLTFTFMAIILFKVLLGM